MSTERPGDDEAAAIAWPSPRKRVRLHNCSTAASGHVAVARDDAFAVAC